MSMPSDAPPPDAGASVYRTLFAACPDALLLVAADGCIALANPAAAELLGYASDQLVGLSVDALVPDAIRPRHAAYRAGYAEAPHARPMGAQTDLIAKRRDGSEVMVEIALSPLREQGRPYVVAAIRGIGAYPRVRQALRRARYGEHLAQLGRLAVDARDPSELLQQVPAIAAAGLEVEVSLVYLLEGDGQQLRLAGGVGMIAGEALGTRWPNRPDNPPGYVVAEARAVLIEDYRREPRFAVPEAYLRAGLVSALGVPLTDRGRVIGALTVRSRTPQRFGADEERFLSSLANLLGTCLQRARTEEALNHAQRLESVGQLTGGIAHDFNNLLTVIQGNLQVLEELPGVAGDAQVLVQAAARAARRGAELTGKLLAFSRRQMLQPSRVDLSALLDSLTDMLRRTLDQRIAIELEVAPGCPALRADPGQLEAALLNIAINARDAMPDGGTLRFAAAALDAPPPGLAPELDARGRYVAIRVSDSGCGMPEAVRERAFEPFFTTKQSGRGTGLGLSTVYGFVKQSSGAVTLDSAPGRGTTLCLVLPAEAGGAVPGATGAEGPDALPPGLAVLLVEDDTEVRAVARHFLAGMGCELSICASAEAALALLTPDARFDLLVTDIALGAGMRGTELARVAQERLPGLGVLLVSGYSDELLRADREAPAAWELLPKPYSRGELAQAIARVIAR
ncbi:MAG: PAS domain S-box protein [Pelomonas sp.]|nr:PAS domain S-box protein [Roseateles sp.]